MATKKAAKKKSSASHSNKKAAKKSRKRSTTPPSKRWSSKVKTDSTKPGPGLFKKSAKAIAEGLDKKSVSPEGTGQAMRMLSFYENRAGKNLSAERKHTLENAKDILRKKEDRSGGKSSRRGTRKRHSKKAA
ncbi:MAG TPA: DUF3175 domain-containing protein [Acidobacteriaceae bacterium]|nr:DUF3175 domain-containing protein [Acidobacteriaceae bacterium]